MKEITDAIVAIFPTLTDLNAVTTTLRTGTAKRKDKLPLVIENSITGLLYRKTNQEHIYDHLVQIDGYMVGKDASENLAGLIRDGFNEAVWESGDGRVKVELMIYRPSQYLKEPEPDIDTKADVYHSVNEFKATVYIKR